METDEGLKEYVREKVQKLQKYIENPRDVHVVLSSEKFRHVAELTITGNGMALNSEARDRDIYAAIDQMVEKMSRQIKQRRERLRGKKGNQKGSKKFISKEEEIPEDRNGLEILSTIRKRRIMAKPMSLEEAFYQLRLSKEPFLFFINEASEQMNVL
jgi:putative sigma-54 modulation protein